MDWPLRLESCTTVSGQYGKSDPAMRDWRVIFGKNVRRVRQQKGLTQEELAFEAEIDLTYMGGIEARQTKPQPVSYG